MLFPLVALLASALAQPVKRDDEFHTSQGKPYAIFQPKVVVVSMFEPERAPWLEALDFVNNITIPGLSPLFPEVYCTTNYSICQVTTGEGEINAASTITAFGLSALFDLSKTYFLIAGIAGGEPQYTTLGSATFNKYAVQGALEYQVDYKEYIATNPNWTSGYFAYGTDNPWEYPANVYGTEVFEVNEKLRDRAFLLASNATLAEGSTQNRAFSQLYDEKAAKALPAAVKCDGMTSDNYFFGNVLSDYFSFFTSLMTNGLATYCVTAQEDNASLEAFTRLDSHGLVDYSRIVVMRTVSDYDRPPPSWANDTVGFFNEADQGGSHVAFVNLVNAGLPFVTDVISNWDSVYKSGDKYKPDNYIGDIYGTLGGTPDFGKEEFEIA